MLRSAASKVAWVGRTASMVFGLALVMALLFGVASTAFGANGGSFILGKATNAATKVTGLIGRVATGEALVVKNPSGGSALGLSVGDPLADPATKTVAPMKVDSQAVVGNLNADKLDGQEASELAEPRGYAHVKPEGLIDISYPSKGVVDIIRLNDDITGELKLYCFNLTFTPKTAVGSPHPLNSAVVGTATPDLDNNPGNDIVADRCPTNYEDAAVKTYGSSEGNAAPINFQIVFE